MEKEELLEALRHCEDYGDEEIAHENADRLLLSYINDEEIRTAYDAIAKWYA